MLITSLRAGGIKRVVLNLAGEFTRNGSSVELFVLDPQGPYADAVPEAVRLTVLEARLPHPGDPDLGIPLAARLLTLRADPAGLARLARPVLLARKTYRELHYLPDLVRKLGSSRPRAVVSALPENNLLAVWASRLVQPRPRVVVTEHTTHTSELGHKRPKQWFKRFLPEIMCRTYGLADAIVAVSDGAADDLAAFTGLSRERIQTIYNPVVPANIEELAAAPVQHPWFLPGEPPVVLAAGRFHPQKDFATLVRAFAKVRGEGRARLVIFGEDTDRVRDRTVREALTKLADELGVAEDVSLPGWTANPFAHMARAAVFVLSSRCEGFGNVLAEAMACGCPVVSTDCPSGPSEVLDGGRYGRLVPVGDDLALAKAMQETLQSPPIAEMLRRRARCFSVRGKTESYLKLMGRR